MPLFHFLDSAVPPSAFAWLPEVMKGTGASWYGFVRPTMHLMRPDGLLDRLAESGCAMLQTGVESGSRRILDRFGKGLDPSTAAQVLRLSAEAGIRNYVYLLFGLPGETVEDRELTLGLMEETSDSIDFLNASVFNLPWNSELSSRAEEFGMEPGDFDAPAPLDQALPALHLQDRESPRPTPGLSSANDSQPCRRHPRHSSRTPRWFRGSHMAMTRLPGRRDPQR